MTVRTPDLFSWYGDDNADIVRLYCDAQKTKRIFVYRRRKDGTFSYAVQSLSFDEYEQCFYWSGTENPLSFYGSESEILRDIAPLLEGMAEYPRKED